MERHGAALADAERVVVVVHGRGQDPAWMYEHLVARLNVSGTAYLLPAAEGQTWYPAGFMAPSADNEPHLTCALARVHGVVTDLLETGRDVRDVFLVGFSQGACLVLEYLARNPASFAGIAALTGGLIGPPGTAWDPISIPGVPVVLATSDVDEWVPLSRVEETRDVLRSAGAEVIWRVYEGMGHEICDDEIHLVNDLLISVDQNASQRSAAS